MNNCHVLKPIAKTFFVLALASGIMHQAIASPSFINLDAGPANWVTNLPRVVDQVTTGTGIPMPAMWANCPAGDPTCNNNRTAMAKTFVFDQGATVGGAFNILADDLLVFNINGKFFSAVLTQNQNNTTAVPLAFRVEQYDLVLTGGTLLASPLGTVGSGETTFSNIFNVGANNFEIQAFDGDFASAGNCSIANTYDIPGSDQNWCIADKVNQYVHIEGGILQVPEPGSLALVALGLAGIGSFARRRLGANVLS